MSNPDIERINQTLLNNRQDVLNLLGISDPLPSVADVLKAYRKLALSIHPDENRDEYEAATQACQKLFQAKEQAISRDTFKSKFANSQAVNLDQRLIALFKKESKWMTSQPRVKKARDIILTWVGNFDKEFDKEINPVKCQKIKGFFKDLTLGNDEVAAKDKANLLQYVELLFPDDHMLTAEIIEKCKLQDLEDNVLFLSNLVSRYPSLRAKYQNALKAKVIKFLKNTEELLDSLITKIDVTENFENQTLPRFESFKQFAYAFCGSEERIDEDGLQILDPAIEDGFAVLDQCVKQDPALFSHLVKQANFLRGCIKPDEEFIYSETALEADPQKARQINNLCKEQTKLNVLNAQLSHIIQLILGKQFNNVKPNELQNRFPKEEYIWKTEQVVVNGNPSRKYKNVLTGELESPTTTLRRNPKLSDPKNRINAVIPENPKKNNSIIDAYKKHYVECNGISFISKMDGESSETYEKVGVLKSSILSMIEKSWVNLRSHIVTLDLNIEQGETTGEEQVTATQLKEDDNIFDSENSVEADEAAKAKEEIRNKLQSYITKIDSYNGDYTYGFWFFPKSRAINRQANYLLAKKFQNDLIQDLQIASVFSNIRDKRIQIISEAQLDKNPNYIERGINSSELKDVIEAALTHPYSSKT